ncbi:MAG: ribbon-helix-helix domain-containing protein [Microcoleus sp.]|uniref:ribbon-helix-helix domain-containing protein n=1 Tax=Microcoleus sp. CAWBG640 TaxID=2841653 RepID=UPI00312BA08D
MIGSVSKKQVFTVSKRVHITLPDYIYESLELWADRQGRPTASLIAFIVETAVLEAKKKGDLPSGPQKPKNDT